MWVGRNRVENCFWGRWKKGRGEGHFQGHLLYIEILFLPTVKHFDFDKFPFGWIHSNRALVRVWIQIGPILQQCQNNRLNAQNTDCCWFHGCLQGLVVNVRGGTLQSPKVLRVALCKVQLYLKRIMRDPLFQLLPSTHEVDNIVRRLLELIGNTKCTLTELGSNINTIVQTVISVTTYLSTGNSDKYSTKTNGLNKLISK